MSPGVLPAWRKRKKWRLVEPAHREARSVRHKPGKGRDISQTRGRPPHPGKHCHLPLPVHAAGPARLPLAPASSAVRVRQSRQQRGSQLPLPRATSQLGWKTAKHSGALREGSTAEKGDAACIQMSAS